MEFTKLLPLAPIHHSVLNVVMLAWDSTRLSSVTWLLPIKDTRESPGGRNRDKRFAPSAPSVSPRHSPLRQAARLVGGFSFLQHHQTQSLSPSVVPVEPPSHLTGSQVCIPAPWVPSPKHQVSGAPSSGICIPALRVFPLSSWSLPQSSSDVWHGPTGASSELLGSNSVPLPLFRQVLSLYDLIVPHFLQHLLNQFPVIYYLCWNMDFVFLSGPCQFCFSDCILLIYFGGEKK